MRPRAGTCHSCPAGTQPSDACNSRVACSQAACACARSPELMLTAQRGSARVLTHRPAALHPGHRPLTRRQCGRGACEAPGRQRPERASRVGTRHSRRRGGAAVMGGGRVARRQGGGCQAGAHGPPEEGLEGEWWPQLMRPLQLPLSVAGTGTHGMASSPRPVCTIGTARGSVTSQTVGCSRQVLALCGPSQRQCAYAADVPPPVSCPSPADQPSEGLAHACCRPPAGSRGCHQVAAE